VDNFKKINRDIERKIFNLTDPSGRNISREGGVIVQLKENFHVELVPEASTAKVLAQHDKSTESFHTD
jgi:hypothetical protein